jgi:hypothetical protein
MYKNRKKGPRVPCASRSTQRGRSAQLAGGIAGSLFTLFMLFRNGVMLGAFQWFYQKGVLLYLGAHHLVRLPRISTIICSPGGRVMYSPLSSASPPRIAAPRQPGGMKLVIGLVPVFDQLPGLH